MAEISLVVRANRVGLVMVNGIGGRKKAKTGFIHHVKTDDPVFAEFQKVRYGITYFLMNFPVATLSLLRHETK